VVILVALIVLGAIGLLVCAGAIVAPFVVFRLSAVARDEAELAQKQANEVVRKAAQDAATRQQSAAEPDRAQPE
jgi:hypothetical protein